MSNSKKFKFSTLFLISTLLIGFQNCSKFTTKNNSNGAILPNETSDNSNIENIDNSVNPLPPPFQALGPFDVESLNDVFVADVPKLGNPVEVKSLKLNLWYPKGVSSALPVIVHIHGGGWKSGDYNQCFNFSNNGTSTSLCKSMAARGYAVASITYRLSSEGKFPDQLHDVKAAIKFIRKNGNQLAGGKFFLDTDRIAVFGSSAGGHLASLIGTTFNVSTDLEGDLFPGYSSEVKGVVSFYGPTDFLQMDKQLAETFSTFNSHNSSNSGESLLVNCLTQLTNCVDLVEAANPITYINGDEPPFLLRHGRADKIVPFQQSEIIHDALIRNNRFSDIKILDGVEHSFNADIGSNVLAAEAYHDAVEFFDRVLKEIDPIN